MLIEKLLAVAQVGGSAVLYILIALSIWSISIILERWWFYRSRRVNAPQLAEQLLKKLHENDRKGAMAALQASKSIEAEVLAGGLEWYDRGPDAVREILVKGVRDRRKATERGLLFLGTLGNNAPFIGLFGTVLGIVTAFKELGAAASGGGGAGNMNSVMGGIAEALIATAVGILAAIPAVVAYNTFTKKAGDIEENVGALGNALIAYMKGDEHLDHPLAETRSSGANPTATRRDRLHSVAKQEAEA
jgi:biopolymer transport protein ExbB/TolQ